jgi:hypothetical protein
MKENITAALKRQQQQVDDISINAGVNISQSEDDSSF